METDPKHALASLAVWPDIRKAVTDGEAAVLAGPENTYLMDGLDRSLLEGPEAVDRKQLELAVELLVDAALQRGDTETIDALGTASPLGNLIGADHQARTPSGRPPRRRTTTRSRPGRAGRPVQPHPGLGRRTRLTRAPAEPDLAAA